jgi:hypothetical protein
MVRFLSYTSGARKVIATVDVDDDGDVVIEGRLPALIEREVRAARQRASSAEAFLNSLPRIFSGSYIRAELA